MKEINVKLDDVRELVKPAYTYLLKNIQDK
jgi:hypothetical protein